jgi:hypothetical protein
MFKLKFHILTPACAEDGTFIYHITKHQENYLEIFSYKGEYFKIRITPSLIKNIKERLGRSKSAIGFRLYREFTVKNGKRYYRFAIIKSDPNLKE